MPLVALVAPRAPAALELRRPARFGTGRRQPGPGPAWQTSRAGETSISICSICDGDLEVSAMSSKINIWFNGVVVLDSFRQQAKGSIPCECIGCKRVDHFMVY